MITSLLSSIMDSTTKQVVLYKADNYQRCSNNMWTSDKPLINIFSHISIWHNSNCDSEMNAHSKRYTQWTMGDFKVVFTPVFSVHFVENTSAKTKVWNHPLYTYRDLQVVGNNAWKVIGYKCSFTRTIGLGIPLGHVQSSDCSKTFTAQAMRVQWLMQQPAVHTHVFNVPKMEQLKLYVQNYANKLIYQCCSPWLQEGCRILFHLKWLDLGFPKGGSFTYPDSYWFKAENADPKSQKHVLDNSKMFSHFPINHVLERPPLCLSAPTYLLQVVSKISLYGS
jgi:hypothetical protein